MSKRTDLYSAMLGKQTSYVTGIFIDNMPMQLLDNAYTRQICIATNAALLSAANEVVQANELLDITKNQ